VGGHAGGSGCEAAKQRRRDEVKRKGMKGDVVILRFLCILTSTQNHFAKRFLPTASAP
jgi:hypothetical protein